MSKITKEELKKIAELSRIKLTDEEIEKFSGDFDDILDFLSQISNIELSETVKRDFKNVNTFREDEVKETNNRDKIISEMPNTKDDYLVVKKILNN